MSFPIKAVVFDWAGTMIDHGSRAPVLALERVFEQFGVPISEAEARAGMGRSKRDHIRGILAMPRVTDAWRSVAGKTPVEADVTALHDALEPIMRMAARDCGALIAGASELAGKLNAMGVRIGSCTGYTRTMMADILQLAADQGYQPDTVVCSGETAEGRPSPLMLWKALLELDAWPAFACVKVDDATVGIAEGKAACTWTVGVSASGNGVGLSEDALQRLSVDERRARVGAAAQELDAAGADYVIESVADLWPVLEHIASRIENGERPLP